MFCLFTQVFLLIFYYSIAALSCEARFINLCLFFFVDRCCGPRGDPIPGGGIFFTNPPSFVCECVQCHGCFWLVTPPLI